MTLVVVEVVGPLAVASAVITMTVVAAMTVTGTGTVTVTVKIGTTDGMRGAKREVRVDCLRELHSLVISQK